MTDLLTRLTAIAADENAVVAEKPVRLVSLALMEEVIRALRDASTPRDQLATAIMFKALDIDRALWRDPNFLAANSYRIADAMRARSTQPGDHP